MVLGRRLPSSPYRTPMVGPGRQTILNSFAEQLQAERADLVRLIAQETGKPLWETTTDVAISLLSLKVQGGKSAKRSGPTTSHAPAEWSYRTRSAHQQYSGVQVQGTGVCNRRMGSAGWQQAGLPNRVLNPLQVGRETG
ncbi:aldehyde dehydrogenase family protein [Pseudomonas sp. PS02302]|uniref:aldehyde dehydrogenase family protein n=1 Tax=Pseudomonas sp. PS02302 TaxID=2991428 RepID=UPI003FA79EDD